MFQAMAGSPTICWLGSVVIAWPSVVEDALFSRKARQVFALSAAQDVGRLKAFVRPENELPVGWPFGMPRPPRRIKPIVGNVPCAKAGLYLVRPVHLPLRLRHWSNSMRSCDVLAVGRRPWGPISLLGWREVLVDDASELVILGHPVAKAIGLAQVLVSLNHEDSGLDTGVDSVAMNELDVRKGDFVHGERVLWLGGIVAGVRDDDAEDGVIRDISLALSRRRAHLVLGQGPKLRVVVEMEVKCELFLAVLSDHGEKLMVWIRLQGQGGSGRYLTPGALWDMIRASGVLYSAFGPDL